MNYKKTNKTECFGKAQQGESVKNQCVHLGLGMPTTVNV